MASPDRKRWRRAEDLFRRREVAVLLDESEGEPTLEERHELAALVRGDVMLEGRVRALDELADRDDGHTRETYLARHGVAGVRMFRSSVGVRVFMLPVETYPGSVNNLYLAVDGTQRTLVDAGSGTASSRRDLARALRIVSELFGVPVALESLDTVVVTHAHIDHYGGLLDVRERSGARIAVHELDARVLANFEERLVVATRDVDLFMRRAGVSDARRAKLRAQYAHEKKSFRSIEPDRMLHDGDVLGPSMRVHHVPGHCPGLICLQIGNVLLTSDHVTARITPHQFPQAITPFAGLEHYFRSLQRIRALEGIDLALGGHEEPMHDLRGRIDEIATFHRVRLARVLELCASSQSIASIADSMFGTPEGYGALLALLEVGAHVEYLHAIGQLRIANVEDFASLEECVVRYEARA